MSGSSLVFSVVVVVTLGSGAFVVHSQNLVYSAISLFFTLLGVAALYVFMMADFIAATQVVIYVGGILLLIIFGIMLTHRITDVRLSHTSMQRSAGAIAVLLIFIGLVRMIMTSPWYFERAEEPAGTVAGIGKLIMIDYLLPFEVASLLLLAALVGAAMLARKREE